MTSVGSGGGHAQFNDVAAVGFVTALGHLAVDGDHSLPDELLNDGPGQAGEPAMQVLVQTSSDGSPPDAQALGDEFRLGAAVGQFVRRFRLWLRRLIVLIIQSVHGRS